MDTREQIKADSEYFKEVFRSLDEQGCFNDRFPNAGKEYDTETELQDLMRYQETIKRPDSLSFWRCRNVEG